MKLTERKDLMSEWDYEKNNELGLNPKTLLHKSNKKAWWKCSCGHSWQMEIYRRTEGRNCPFCSHKRVLVGFNDLQTLYPEIAKEWHSEKNENIKITDCVRGCVKVVWWKCSTCGHEWKAKICDRTKKGHGCPECAKKIRGKTRHATALANGTPLNNPRLLAEWNYEKNPLSPENYLPGSNETVWWKCQICGHEWKAKVANRAILNRGCPCCANKCAVAGINDLATTHPDLAKEWHPTKNGQLTPQQVVAGKNKKVWWKCPKGHEYQATPNHRISGTNCPICNFGRQTSFAEQAVFYYVQQVFPDAQNRVLGIVGRRMELDIYIPSQKLAIEYDGVFWHKTEKRNRERFKYQECQKNGIRLYRIKEGELTDTHGTADDLFHIDNIENKDQLTLLIRYLLDRIDPRSNLWTRQNLRMFHSPIDVDVRRDEFKIRKYMQELTSGSFIDQYPTLETEWDYEKNTPLTPQMFKAGSSHRVWWKCKVCGHSWKTSINKRTKEHTGCPICYRQNNQGGGNRNAKKIYQYDTEGKLIKRWDSIVEASRALNINHSNISMCAKHYRPLAGGFKWEYAEI